MDKNIANAMLLRLNKQDQIEALKSIGFTTVNENTPASDIAKYMQWSGTLLDLSLATLRIEDGEQVFFTASEWRFASMPLTFSARKNFGCFFRRIRIYS